MLEIRDLHVKFHNRDREAVAGVSFTIENGEITPARFCWTGGNCSTSPAGRCGRSRAGRSAWYSRSHRAAWIL